MGDRLRNVGGALAVLLRGARSESRAIAAIAAIAAVAIAAIAAKGARDALAVLWKGRARSESSGVCRRGLLQELQSLLQ